MDGTRFDRLTRKLSDTGTRRGLLRAARGALAVATSGGELTGAAGPRSTRP